MKSRVSPSKGQPEFPFGTLPFATVFSSFLPHRIHRFIMNNMPITTQTHMIHSIPLKKNTQIFVVSNGTTKSWLISDDLLSVFSSCRWFIVLDHCIVWVKEKERKGYNIYIYRERERNVKCLIVSHKGETYFLSFPLKSYKWELSVERYILRREIVKI